MRTEKGGQRPKAEAKAPRTLTEDECTALLQMLLTGPYNTPLGRRAVRNRTMAVLMLDAGLRVGEVVKLPLFSLLFNGVPVSAVEVPAEIAKGGQGRTIPATMRLKTAIQMMHEWVWRPTYRNENLYAFSTGTGEKSMTVRNVQSLIWSAGSLACRRTITPHMLRHTFATRLMQKTSMRVVQELLGHKRLNSTEIYTHPNHEDKVNAISQLEPNI